MRVLFLFVLLSNLAFAQSNESTVNGILQKNSLSFNVGTALLANGGGIKYERLIPKKSVYYTLSAGAHLFRFDFFTTENHTVLSINNGLITGLDKRNHFEASIGLGWDNVNKEASSGIYGSGGSAASQYSQFIPVANMGYRFQAPNKDFVFRTGIGFPELVYVGLGVAF